jgi:hypothetical protein
MVWCLNGYLGYASIAKNFQALDILFHEFVRFNRSIQFDVKSREHEILLR